MKYTVEEIKEAARAEINRWKDEDEKWNKKDYERFGFVLAVIKNLKEKTTLTNGH